METPRPTIEALQDDISKTQAELRIIESRHRDTAEVLLRRESAKLIEAGGYPQRTVEVKVGNEIVKAPIHVIPLGRIGESEVMGLTRVYEPEYYATPDGRIWHCDSSLDGTLIWHERSNADNMTTIIGVNQALRVFRKALDNLDPTIPPSSPI